MQPPRPPIWPRLLLQTAAFALITAVLVFQAWRSISPDNVCPDFIQFWTAAELLTSGQNPYDPALQASVQAKLGWDRATDGFGMYDYLPYYYPPWLGLAFAPFLLLGFPLAKLTWLILCTEFLVLGGLIAARAARGIGPILAVGVFVGFGFSLKAAAMGQVAPLVLLLIVAAWRLLGQRRDFAAGAMLALLTIKPQLTLLLMGALLAWSMRQSRWRVLSGFFAVLGGLCLGSTVAYPEWLPAMLTATKTTPMTTEFYPGLGTTWHVAISAFGLQGFPLYVAYTMVAMPIMLALLRMTLREDHPVEDLIGATMLAPFFLMPYARAYDLPVLLVPALILMGPQISERLRSLLVFAVVGLTALHMIWLATHYVAPEVGVRNSEYTFLWLPILVAGVWLSCNPDRSRDIGSDSFTNLNQTNP